MEGGAVGDGLIQTWSNPNSGVYVPVGCSSSRCIPFTAITPTTLAAATTTVAAAAVTSGTFLFSLG